MEPVDSFLSSELHWFNDPTKWESASSGDQSEEGAGGAFEITSTGDELRLRAPAKKDFWSRTFYTPLLIKFDASALLCSIHNDIECTARVDFEYDPKTQFDQAGLLVYVDQDHWMKCGIEFCDGEPRLSVVVCNKFSDWSTQPWGATAVSLKIHKVTQSDSLVVEAAPIGTEAYSFVRIAHLSCGEAGNRLPWQVGPYAACPIAQKGCEVTFSKFKVGRKEESLHSSEL